MNLGTSGRSLAAALSLVVLAGCGGSGRTADDGIVPPCPEVQRARDLSELVRYRPGPSRDLTDVEFEAAIVDFAGSCTTRSDQVALDMIVSIDAARGPAATSTTVNVPYLVAVEGPDGEILNRQVFTLQADFSGNRSQVALADRIELIIPLRTGETGAGYRVWLGMLMTEAELQDAQARRGRR